MSPYNKHTLGIGTWNDESYIMISPGQSLSPVEQFRYHLRQNLSGQPAYQIAHDAFKLGDRTVMAQHLRAMKTNETDSLGSVRDVELESLASLVETAGRSDWTIILCKDRNAQGQVTYYIEVYRPYVPAVV